MYFTDIIQTLLDWFSDLSTSITWPITIIAIILLFKKEIRNLINELAGLVPRIEEGHGIKFAPNQTESANPTERQIVTPEVRHSDSGGVSVQSEGYYEEAIENLKKIVPEEQANPIVESFRKTLSTYDKDNFRAQITYLLHFIAALNIYLAHERNYRLLFGSQLFLLRKIYENTSLPLGAARAIYDAATNIPEHKDFYKNYSFEQWKKFLVVSGLCQENGEIITLTVYGEGFLRYMLELKLPENKPF